MPKRHWYRLLPTNTCFLNKDDSSFVNCSPHWSYTDSFCMYSRIFFESFPAVYIRAVDQNIRPKVDGSDAQYLLEKELLEYEQLGKKAPDASPFS